MGFRLAGFEVRITTRDRVKQDLEWACNESSLVMVSAAAAQSLPPQELDAWLSQLTPPVVVVPDVHREVTSPDLAARLRSLLGVEE